MGLKEELEKELWRLAYNKYKQAILAKGWGMSSERWSHHEHTEDLDPSQYKIIDDKPQLIEGPKND